MKSIILILFAIILLTDVEQAHAQVSDTTSFRFEIETGAAWLSRNDVQIPNNEMGTRFSIADLVPNEPTPAFRFYFTWNINERHGLRVLLAPYKIKDAVFPTEPIRFADAPYVADIATEVTYKFNSWRLGYRYRAIDRPSFKGWVGFTGKIRDAKIELKQPNVTASDSDFGFVPLLHLGFDYSFAERWGLLFDVDALAGGPGRAIDGSLELHFQYNPNLSFSAGYRTLEGGADIDRLYNFAWLNFGVISVLYDF